MATKSGNRLVLDYGNWLIAYVRSIEAEAAAQEGDRLREIAEARAEDLGWCNKNDDCHTKSDGAWLVLTDMFPGRYE